MIKINLLAEGKRPAAVRRARPAALLEGKDLSPYMLLGGLLLGLAAAGVWWWRLDGAIEQKQDEIRIAEAEKKKLESISREVEDYKRDKAELERKIGVIVDLKTAQKGPVRVLEHISRSLPELLWLDRMRMTADRIEIEGRALNTNAIANFIENLDKVPAFEEPTLQDTTAQTGGVYKFVINFPYSLKPPGTAASQSVPGTAASQSVPPGTAAGKAAPGAPAAAAGQAPAAPKS